MAMQTIYFRSHIDLQVERHRAGLSQQQLADKAGIHRQTVAYWESQVTREDLGGMYSKAIAKMATAMGLEPYAIDYAYSTDERMCAAMAESLGLGWLYEKPAQKHQYCDANLPNGRTCKKKPIKGKRRCAQHGGLSTGATTEQGRERIRQAQHRRWAKYHANIDRLSSVQQT